MGEITRTNEADIVPFAPNDAGAVSAELTNIVNNGVNDNYNAGTSDVYAGDPGDDISIIHNANRALAAEARLDDLDLPSPDGRVSVNEDDIDALEVRVDELEAVLPVGYHEVDTATYNVGTGSTADHVLHVTTPTAMDTALNWPAASTCYVGEQWRITIGSNARTTFLNVPGGISTIIKAFYGETWWVRVIDTGTALIYTTNAEMPQNTGVLTLSNQGHTFLKNEGPNFRKMLRVINTQTTVTEVVTLPSLSWVNDGDMYRMFLDVSNGLSFSRVEVDAHVDDGAATIYAVQTGSTAREQAFIDFMADIDNGVWLELEGWIKGV